MKRKLVYIVIAVILLSGTIVAYKVFTPCSTPFVAPAVQQGSNASNTPETIWHRLVLNKGLDKIEDTIDNLSFREISQLLSEESMKQLYDIPKDTIYYGIEKVAGISRTEISSAIHPAEYLKKLIGIGLGKNIRPGCELSEIVFAAEINKNNSPVETKTIFNWKTAHKIYACFANNGMLKGLHKVGCRWRNNTSGEIELLGAYFISPSSAYNYIYIEKNDEWTIGSYQVELYDVRTLDIIAKDTFEVK